MSKIDYQALLRAAVKIGAEKWTHDGNGEVTTEEYVADGQTLVDHVCNCEVVGASSLMGEFIALANPATILVLLDELERNQQYIKRRDQENKDIALTVGKLRVELEATENNLIDSECHVAELEEALRDKQVLLEASEKRIAEQSAIVTAAEKLVRCKGRYHSEQNYRALAALFGVTVPDLPPLQADD